MNAPRDLPRATVRLRPPERGDAAALARIQGDPELARLARTCCLHDETEARRWIDDALADPEADTSLVEDPRGAMVGVGRLVGRGALAMISFWIGVRHQGRGLGAAAVGALVSRARARAISRLVAVTLPENRASQGVLVRCGFAPLDTADHRLPEPVLALARRTAGGPATVSAAELAALLVRPAPSC